MTRILRCSFAEQEIFYFVTFNTSKHFFSRNFNTYLSINHYNNLIKLDRLIIKKKKKRTKNKNIFSDSFIENTRQSGRII